METLRTGMSARFETVRDGLVPVKVLSIKRGSVADGLWCRVTFLVTRTRGAYPAGHVDVSSAVHVIPPKAIRRTRYATYVRPFNVECDT